MHCPVCHNTYKCPCQSCVAQRVPDDVPTWQRVDEDSEQCLVCGKTERLEWWLDEEVRQLCTATQTTNLTDAIRAL